jgi:hypothetical protein
MSGKLIDRLETYMTYKGLNNNQITVKAGLSVGLIGKSRETRKGLHSDSIEKILYAFSDLNGDWLLSGRGEMIFAIENSPPGTKSFCPDCKIKDRTIEERDKRIADLERLTRVQADFIDVLKEASPISNTGQKRKAG